MATDLRFTVGVGLDFQSLYDQLRAGAMLYTQWAEDLARQVPSLCRHDRAALPVDGDSVACPDCQRVVGVAMLGGS